VALPTTSRTDVAQALADRIVAALRPWRMVLFGSRARGTARPNSDYDLYIEIGDTERSAGEIHDAIRLLLAKESTSVDLKVNPPGTIERRRVDRSGGVRRATPRVAARIGR
jgi:predicted nucleotidyltransferase